MSYVLGQGKGKIKEGKVLWQEQKAAVAAEIVGEWTWGTQGSQGEAAGSGWAT